MTSTDREDIRRHDGHDADLGLKIPARYRHDWALFADWCAAADHRPIPAAPDTLALFLHEHPAAVATQRRRLSAINAVHTGHGYPPPGRTETVRRHLDTTRASRLDRLGRLLVQRAAELPTEGWPGGLFGRRDALLLVLAATGMTFTDDQPFGAAQRLQAIVRDFAAEVLPVLVAVVDVPLRDVLRDPAAPVDILGSVQLSGHRNPEFAPQCLTGVEPCAQHRPPLIRTELDPPVDRQAGLGVTGVVDVDHAIEMRGHELIMDHASDTHPGRPFASQR